LARAKLDRAGLSGEGKNPVGAKSGFATALHRRGPAHSELPPDVYGLLTLGEARRMQSSDRCGTLMIGNGRVTFRSQAQRRENLRLMRKTHPTPAPDVRSRPSAREQPAANFTVRAL
jgi:hypothetical protein